MAGARGLGGRAGQIIAMGGGGFSMEPDNPLLDEYVLECARRKRPAICFLATASGDAASYIERFYSAFTRLPCAPTHLPLFVTPPPDFASIIARQDIFYVGGGSTHNLVLLWRAWRIDRLLRRAWRRGAVMCGLSAGSLCWFREGLSDSLSRRLQPIRALGWLRGSHCPHYDGEIGRRPAYQRLIRSGRLSAGYGVDDGAALHYVGTRLRRVVSSRPAATAYHVSRRAGRVEERALPARYLGAP